MQYKTIESLIESIQRMNSEIDAIDKTLIDSVNLNQESKKYLSVKLDCLCESIKDKKESLNNLIEQLTNQSL